MEGTVTGSVVHFHWVRNVVIRSGGLVSASGLGNDFTSIPIGQVFLLKLNKLLVCLLSHT